MGDGQVICPHCGAAITLNIGANLDANMPQSSNAISAQNGRIAQMSLGSTKDGRQPYNQAYPAEFLVFWGIYPRKRDKRKALIAWRNAIRRGAIEEINNGAIAYRNDPNRLDEFTKYAEGWLNGDGWLDEALPSRQPKTRPDPPRSMTAGDMDVAWEIERSRDA